jgi:hypothetical protein
MTSALKRIFLRATWEDGMNDQATILTALSRAALIIADHFEPGLPRDPLATVKTLIEVLDSQELAAAIRRTERSQGLRVVK